MLFDSFAVGMLAMLAESLVALAVNPGERSRVMAVQRTAVGLCVAPWGWVSGMLSEVNRSLPFVLTSCFVLAGLAVTLLYYRRQDRRPAPGGPESPDVVV